MFLRRLLTGLVVACAGPLGLGGTTAAHAVVDNQLVLASDRPESFQLVSNGDISRDGRTAVYLASDLARRDGGAPDPYTGVFKRDLVTGSLSLIGDPAQSGDPSSPRVSGDGRFVAFAGTTNEGVEVFLHDATTGQVTRVSRPVAMWSTAVHVDISADGRFVVYTRTFQAGDDEFDTYLYRYEIATGRTMRPLSADLGGDAFGIPVAVSGTGRFIVTTRASIADPVLFPVPDEVVYRLIRVDAASRTSAVVTTSAPTPATYASPLGDFAVDDSGGLVAFDPRKYEPAEAGIRLWDANTGTTELVSKNLAGGVPEPFTSVYQAVSISGDGRYVGYSTTAQGIVAESVSRSAAYLYDRETKATQILVRNLTGKIPAGGADRIVGISRHGTRVALVSDARYLAQPEYAAGDPKVRVQRLVVWQGR